MNWTLSLYALAAVSVFSVLAAAYGSSVSRRKNENPSPLNEYLLANEGLERQSVIQLLLSSSFSLNGMLYQVWLGYSIGLWALLVQGAWALSYVLLGSHIEKIRETKSLHHFLGNNFGPATRVLAGVCSILGMTILVGWEFNVAKSTFDGLIQSIDGGEGAIDNSLVYITGVVLAALIYTSIGGLRGNAYANMLQNIFKAGIFILTIALLFNNLPQNDQFLNALFPPFSEMINNLGAFGLITNIAFSLVWQFVDMSTWQSVIASNRKLNAFQAKGALRGGGLAVFFFPGVVGTLLGALLINTPGVTSDTVMTSLVSSIPDHSWLLLFVVIAIISCVMSMVDGVLLAAAYALVCDILYPNKSLSEIDENKELAYKVIGLIRVFLWVIAIFGTIIFYNVINKLSISLFDAVYILIVCQCSLVGPVIFALWRQSRAGSLMILSIVSGLIVGFGSLWIGGIAKAEWLLTGAGLFTMIASFVSASVLTVIGKYKYLSTEGL